MNGKRSNDNYTRGIVIQERYARLADECERAKFQKDSSAQRSLICSVLVLTRRLIVLIHRDGEEEEKTSVGSLSLAAINPSRELRMNE